MPFAPLALLALFALLAPNPRAASWNGSSQVELVESAKWGWPMQPKHGEWGELRFSITFLTARLAWTGAANGCTL